jgi:hypothetical protein
MKHRKKRGSGGSLGMIRKYFPQVEFVKDATKTEIVEVTVADNDNSEVKSHRTCALALACKRFFKADGVIIGLTTSWIIRGKVATRFLNAATVSREITSFDRKAGFDAGRYLLTPVPETSRLGRQKAYDPHRKGTRSGIRKFRHYTRGVRTSLHAHNEPAAA